MQSTRKLTVTMLVLVITILFLTALVLFFAPGSKEAALTGWNILGIDKSSFKLMHKIFGVTLCVLVLNHIILNRRAIGNYFRKSKTGMALSAPAIGAIVVVAILFACAIIFGQTPAPDSLGGVIEQIKIN